MDVIRVMIADDEPGVLDALSEFIRDEPTLELVGAAGDAEEAIRVACSERPDVALLDVRMPGGGGARAAREIGGCSPETRVIALSAHDDRSSVIDMLRSGAVGYLVKGATAEDILAALRRSARGQSSLSPEVATEVIRELVGHLDTHDRESKLQQRRIDLMRRVVQGQGLEMAFQPIMNLGDGRVVGLEALARFGGKPPRPPDQWFQEAADIGLRVDLELAAVRVALGHLDRVPEGVYLAVNISPDTAISEPFLSFLGETVLDRLVFEVSEHARVDDYDVLNRSLGKLRAKGGRLAIDDAGAGFSSLQHILTLSPDIIKLDIKLTRGVDTDQARRALATALTSFAAEIGAMIVAEGVETREELEALRALGVSHGQGYFLGYPVPFGTILERLATGAVSGTPEGPRLPLS